MIRKQQIEEAAMAYLATQYATNSDVEFIKGAEWADKNPDINDFGKETLILQECYKKIDTLQYERDLLIGSLSKIKK